MNVLDWAASESKSNIFLLRLVDHPLLAWLRWNTGFSMDIIRVGFKYSVVGSIGILLALVGLSLSILSAALNRAIPAALVQPPVNPREGVRRPRHSRVSDVSATSQSSQSELRSRLPVATPHTPRIVIEPADASTAVSDVTSIPTSSASSSALHQPLAHDSLEERDIPNASTLEKTHARHDEERHRESRRPLSVKRLAIALEQRKKLLRTQSLAVTGTASQALSLGTSSGSAGASSSRQPLAGITESKDVGRTASAPHDLVKAKFLPRKQHSAPPDKRIASVQRTDPYGAPYYFPTPGSPQAADYVRQVRSGRSPSNAPAGHVTFEQRLEPSNKGKSPMTSAGSPQLDPPRPAHSRTRSEDRIERRASLDSPLPTTKSTRRKSWHVMSRLSATEETAEAEDNVPARTGGAPLSSQRLKLGKSRSSPARSRQPSVPSSPVLSSSEEVSSPVQASPKEPKPSAPGPPDQPAHKRLWRSLQHRR